MEKQKQEIVRFEDSKYDQDFRIDPLTTMDTITQELKQQKNALKEKSEAEIERKKLLEKDEKEKEITELKNRLKDIENQTPVSPH